MKKKVDINVVGIHLRDGNEEERIDTCSQGVYEIMEDGSVCVIYEEAQDVGGQRIKISNKVTVSNDLRNIEIVRTGAVSSKMVFGPDVYIMDYKTPYGVMQMELLTKKLDVKKDEKDSISEISAEYMLKAGNDILSDSKMIIEIKGRI